MTEIRIDERGVELRGRTGALDVDFDHRHVWSFDPPPPVGDGPEESAVLVRWPQQISGRLDGTVLVTVRTSGADTVLHREECRFGTGEGRVELTDANGVPVMVDKWGLLQKPFSGRDPRVLQQMLETTQQILDVLSRHCGLHAWVAFGSLLGAVREGRLIGHDSDVDIAYLSDQEAPVLIAREMFDVARALRQHGLRVGDRAATFVTVFFEGADGSPGSIDVYACFYLEGFLYEHATVRAPIPRTALLPLGTGELEGHRIPVPADPDALLTASYGPDWRVPDPSFRYRTPTPVKRRFTGWFGAYMRHRRPWANYYGTAEAWGLLERPSECARWAGERLPADAVVVDVGAGNGRDSLFFAERGHPVVALDMAGLAPLHKEAGRRGLEVRRERMNFYDQRDVLSLGALLCRELARPRVVYARFLLHAIEDDGEQNFWRLTRMLCQHGGRAVLEFRTLRDAGRHHDATARYRRFLDPERVVADLERQGGAVVERHSGTGMARQGEEDAHVCRLLASWPHPGGPGQKEEP